MKQVVVIAIIGLLFMGSPSVRAESENPFGFETNKHPLTYEYCKKMETTSFKLGYEYECSSAPRKHPDIRRIHLHFVEDVGLCSIKAMSFDFLGDDRRDPVDSFKDRVAQKYGPPTSKTEEGDLKDPFSSNVKYRYDWDQRAGFSGLGDVVSIHVVLFPHVSMTVQVIFELNTREACDKKEDEMRTIAF